MMKEPERLELAIMAARNGRNESARASALIVIAQELRLIRQQLGRLIMEQKVEPSNEEE